MCLVSSIGGLFKKQDKNIVGCQNFEGSKLVLRLDEQQVQELVFKTGFEELLFQGKGVDLEWRH
jgi:hypothetical protein